MRGSVLGLVLFVCDFVRFRSVRNKALGSVRGDSVSRACGSLWYSVRVQLGLRTAAFSFV